MKTISNPRTQFTIRMRHPEFGEMETQPTPKVVMPKNTEVVSVVVYEESGKGEMLYKKEIKI